MWERFSGSERRKSRAEEVYSDSYRCNTCGRKWAEARQQAACFVSNVRQTDITSRNLCWRNENWVIIKVTVTVQNKATIWLPSLVPQSVKPELMTPDLGRTPPTSPWQVYKGPRCCLYFPAIPDKPQLVSGVYATVFPTTHLLPSISWTPFASFSREILHLCSLHKPSATTHSWKKQNI